MSQEPYQGQQQRNQTLSKELRSRAELRAQGPCRNRSAVLGRVPSWPAKGLVQPHTAQRPRHSHQGPWEPCAVYTSSPMRMPWWSRHGPRADKLREALLRPGLQPPPLVKAKRTETTTLGTGIAQRPPRFSPLSPARRL